MLKSTFLALSILLVPVLASAQALKPYPEAQITTAQWQAYYDEVHKKFGESVQDSNEQKLMVLTDSSTGTLYSFTKQGHPAHPAWVTRRVEQRGEQLFVNQVGYFAGEEVPFAKLFHAYQRLNEKMQQDLQQRREAAKANKP